MVATARGENLIETDVLVIGGGMAGCFAAIKAREKGASVTLVDKGYVGKSGQTPFAGTFAVFNPDWGHDLDAWMRQVNSVGEYVNDREWTEIGFLDSYDRYQDLVSWGVEFREPPRGNGPGPRPPRGPCEAKAMPWRQHAEILRKQVKLSGASIVDRVMIVDLLSADGVICGAVGLGADNGELYVFRAKATVMCAGAGAFKPPGWPIHELTSDGDAMAYRAGAAITGKEFSDPHPTSGENPAHFGSIMRDGRPIFGRLYNALGEAVTGRGTLFINMEFEAHAGRAPLTQKTALGDYTRVGGGASGMSVHKAEGIWPAGADCSTNLPGLYAAGDALGTMQSGAVYAAIGMALSGAAVTGARAGWSAAKHARQTDAPSALTGELPQVRELVYAPMRRRGGFGPRWVTQVLQNTMIPYFVMYIKHGDRLQAALTLVEFMRDHLVPKLTAADPHELRLAHEAKNMVLNAEMRLRASLFRTESRGCHYREDYPRRDDPGWLAWVLLQQEDGDMQMTKESIPQEWWPDLTTPYEKRYDYHFPVF
jgi:succinate dehydrogenase/fumarate reductase flavoprotein subunit